MVFVKFVLNGWENEIVPSFSESRGTKWPGFDRVEVVHSVLLNGLADFREIWQVGPFQTLVVGLRTLATQIA